MIGFIFCSFEKKKQQEHLEKPIKNDFKLFTAENLNPSFCFKQSNKSNGPFE